MAEYLNRLVDTESMYNVIEFSLFGFWASGLGKGIVLGSHGTTTTAEGQTPAFAVELGRLSFDECTVYFLSEDGSLKFFYDGQ